MAHDPEALIRRWYHEGWNDGDSQVFRELLAPNFTLRDVLREKQVTDATHFIDLADAFRKAYDGLRFSVEETIPAGDAVAVRVRMTRKPDLDVEITAVVIFNRDGRIVEAWNSGTLPDQRTK